MKELHRFGKFYRYPQIANLIFCTFSYCGSLRANETKFDSWNLSGQLANHHYFVKDLQLILIEELLYLLLLFQKVAYFFFFFLKLIVPTSWDKIKLFFLGSLVDGTNGPFWSQASCRCMFCGKNNLISSFGNINPN